MAVFMSRMLRPMLIRQLLDCILLIELKQCGSIYWVHLSHCLVPSSLQVVADNFAMGHKNLCTRRNIEQWMTCILMSEFTYNQ